MNVNIQIWNMSMKNINRPNGNLQQNGFLFLPVPSNVVCHWHILPHLLPSTQTTLRYFQCIKGHLHLLAMLVQDGGGYQLEKGIKKKIGSTSHKQADLNKLNINFNINSHSWLMLVAWLDWNFKKWSVSSLASCLRANRISLFRKANHTLSETNSKRPRENWWLEDKTKSFPFGSLGPPFFQFQFQVLDKITPGSHSIPQPTGLSTLAKSSAGSAGPPVKVSPVMGSSASPKTSWMTPHGKRWISTGTPPKLNSLPPQKWWFKDFPLLFGEDLFSGAMLNFGGVENLPFLFILVQRNIGSPPKFRCRWLWEEG